MHPSINQHQARAFLKMLRHFGVAVRSIKSTRTTRLCSATFSTDASVDYIILGAGSAGSVLSNRISNQPSAPTVLTLEAGTHGEKSLVDSWKIRIPSALTYNLDESSAYNWHYMTTPQRGLNGRQIDQPRGKVVGGSSCLNAMVYIRGHAEDYERWATEVHDGIIDWSYKNVLPYFKRAQNSQTPSPPCPSPQQITGKELDESFPPMEVYKGYDGPLQVTNGSSLSKKSGRSGLFDTFVKAAVAAGYKYTPDLNGFRQEGFGPMDQTVTADGVRCSVSVVRFVSYSDKP
jgi:choline dehydrogenase